MSSVTPQHCRQTPDQLVPVSSVTSLQGALWWCVCVWGHRWMIWLSVIIAEVSDELSRRCISLSGSKRSKRGSNVNQMIQMIFVSFSLI